MEAIKYRLTSNTKDIFGKTLYQIEALKDFSNVKKGDIGGWVEKETNLSQYGDAWAYDNANVYGNARVYGDANVCDNAWAYDNANVYGNARVYGDANVCDNAWVCGNAKVYDNAKVRGDAKVYDNANVYGNARVYGDANVCGDASVYGHSAVMWITGIGSRNGTTTAFKCKNETIAIACGCFEGSLDDFEKAVIEKHGDNKFGREYKALINLIKIHFEMEG